MLTCYVLRINRDHQAKRLKVEFLVLHRLKLMARMHSAYLHACAFSDLHMK